MITSNDPKINAVLRTVISQRDSALDAVVQLNGELAVRDAKIAELQEAVDAAMKFQAEVQKSNVTPIDSAHAA